MVTFEQHLQEIGAIFANGEKSKMAFLEYVWVSVCNNHFKPHLLSTVGLFFVPFSTATQWMNSGWMDCCRTLYRFFREVWIDVSQFVMDWKLWKAQYISVNMKVLSTGHKRNLNIYNVISTEIWVDHLYCVQTIRQWSIWWLEVTTQPLDNIKIHWLILLLCWQSFINLHFLFAPRTLKLEACVQAKPCQNLWHCAVSTWIGFSVFFSNMFI